MSTVVKRDACFFMHIVSVWDMFPLLLLLTYVLLWLKIPVNMNIGGANPHSVDCISVSDY